MSTPTGPAAEIDPRVHANRWRILGVLCLSLMVIMIANGSLNVALPQLADSLDASSSQLQWMVDAYSLVFAGMLFTAGTIGDRFGRKLALQGGLVLFLLGAIAAALSQNAGQVIAARAVMGLAAAFVMPSTLSLLTNVFPAHERARAISTWAGVAAGGAALGPPISGFLIEHYWWGSVFLINVPLLVIALIAGRMLPESKNPDEHHVDVPGAVLSILAISVLVYAIIEAPAHGWGSTETLVAFLLAAAALAAFVARERRTSEPMFDLALLRDVRFSAASTGITVCFFAMFGVMFLLAQYLQMVLGYSPFHAGMLMLPMPLTMMVVAPQAPKLVERFGITRVVPAGMTSIVAGLCVLSTFGPDTPVGAIYIALLPMMIGMAVTMSPFTTMIMTSIPPARAGMGSATNDTTRELGGALGVAVLGSVVTTHFRAASIAGLDALPADAQAEARTGLPGAIQAAGSTSSDVGRRLVADAQRAFTEGLGTAALVSAGVVGVSAALITLVLARKAVPAPSRALGAELDATETSPTEIGELQVPG